MSWGGRRAGAGRPRKEKSDASPSRSIRAKDEEWVIIKAFAQLIKWGYDYECEKMLRELLEDLDETHPIEDSNEESFSEWYWKLKNGVKILELKEEE